MTERAQTAREDIRFYCGINEVNWNGHPVSPGPYTVIAPIYGRSTGTQRVNSICLPSDTEVIADSGAFAESRRVSEEEALDRQIWHAYRYRYVKQITHIASHDLLIDEKWQDGARSKIRWSKEEAQAAVTATINAATYLVRRRRAIAGQFGHKVGFVLSAQGVDVEQYLACAKAIVPLMHNDDLFGLGGFCITGVLPDAIMPSFSAIMQAVIPYLASQHIHRVHIWGVCFPEALGLLFALCQHYQIKLSTDSSGPQRKPMFGEWGYGSWRNNAYKRAPILGSCKLGTCQPETFCRGLERIRHLNCTRDYLAYFCDREPALCQLPAPTLATPALYQQLSWIAGH